jgi:hypothetical protein
VYDLKASLAVAKAVKEQGGNACTVEQLAAYLAYKNTRGGGFVSRVAAAKAFGLIRTVQGRYETSPRAEAILYPVTNDSKQQELRDSFLGIPLYRQVYDRYRGVQLPEESGMRNLLQTQYRIPAGGRAGLAYRVLMDSAETAGFFSANQGRRTHLIDPGSSARPAVPSNTDNGSTSAPTTAGASIGPGSERSGRGRYSKLIEGALELLPDEAGWDETSMDEWFEFFKSAVRMSYKPRRAQK